MSGLVGMSLTYSLEVSAEKSLGIACILEAYFDIFSFCFRSLLIHALLLWGIFLTKMLLQSEGHLRHH